MTFLEVLVVVTAAIVPNIIAGISFHKYIDRHLETPPLAKIANQLTGKISIVLLLVYFSLNHTHKLASVGLDLVKCDLVFLITGSITVNFVLTILSAIIRRITRGEPIRYTEVDYTRPDVRLAVSYRTLGERLLYLIILVVGVVAEELVYRGYLVLFLGNVTGLLVLCSVISIMLSVINHLYQGRSTVVHHFLFATVAVVVTIVTGSILLPIGFHLYGNIVHAIWIWTVEHQSTSQQDQKAEHKTSRPFRFLDMGLRLLNALMLGIFLFVYFLPATETLPSMAVEHLICRRSELYQLALEEAQSHPDVIAAIGEPIEPSLGCGYHVEFGGNGTTNADLTIPVIGSHDSGIMHITAFKEEVWEFSEFIMIVDEQQIKLLESID